MNIQDAMMETTQTNAVIARHMRDALLSMADRLSIPVEGLLP